MLKQCLFILLLCSVFTSALATLETQIDKTNLASDEILTLVISSKDHISFSPDLTPLSKDFQIVGTRRSSQISIINGTTHMETQWQIALMPKHDGDLALPVIQVGNEKTESRLIHVTAVNKVPPSTASAPNQGIFIEATVIPKEMYIQEQLVYRLKVYYSRTVENPYLAPPDLPDAKMTQNGQDIIYSTVKNGKYYRVLERSYLLTPKNTGHFQIQPPVLKGYVEDSINLVDAYGFASRSLRPIKVVGPTLEINVKSKPTHYRGQWLPAKKLTINELWEPNPPVFREGEPVTRIVEVVATGSTGDQIPNVDLVTTPNLNSYPQQPERVTDTNTDIQIGKLKQKIVFIPTTSGKVTFPSIKMHWWNTATQKEQVTILPSKTVTVLPALMKTPPNQNNLTSSQSRSAPLQLANKEREPGFNFSALQHYFWPLIAILFSIAWLLTLWLWRRQIKSNGTSQIKKRINLLSLPEIQFHLREACLSGNTKETRRYFLQWASTYWKADSLHSLTDIVHILEKQKAPELLREIMQLEATFYSHHPQNWNGSIFWYAFESYLQSSEVPKDQTSDPLPPLYFSS